jgi:hypothetical protein
MTSQQIETWALRVIHQVEANQPMEDARVELKREWPTNLNQAARQLAGHANAAHGEDILWLIGADEKQGIVGATAQNLATWFSVLQAEFDAVAPPISDVNVPWNGKTIVALHFETERAPFVVRNVVHGNPQGGPVSRELPWREGTAVRSATRADVLRLLTPLARLPGVEWLGLALWASDIKGKAAWRLDAYLYVVPPPDGETVIAAHRCDLWFEMVGKIARTALTGLTFGSDSSLNKTSRSSLVISTPGLITLSAVCPDACPQIPAFDPVQVGVTVRPIHSESAIVFEQTLAHVPGRQDYLGLWAHGRYEG